MKSDRNSDAEGGIGVTLSEPVRPPKGSMVWVVRRVNIGDPDFVYTNDDPEGFRGGLFRFGAKLGAEQLGTSVYELPPGQSICPYHYEYADEDGGRRAPMP
jgi:hypothetical protein